MASQADLQNQLKAQDAIIINIENRLARISPRASISTVNALKAQLAKAIEEKARIEKELKDLTTTQTYQSNQGTADTGKTAKSSESKLLEALRAINQRIIEIENQLKSIPAPSPQKRLELERGLRINEKYREEILKELATTDTGDEYNRLLRRAPRPVTQATNAVPTQSTTGLAGQVTDTRKQATASQLVKPSIQEDWRFRIYLAPNSNYLYNDKQNQLLKPLDGVGVIFPYTPTVSVSYVANYDPQNVTHSNYKLYFYKDSAVENISITGEFTAQNTEEANYLLAVIHFFKSVTKMFYGNDNNPVNGTPPPICYIDGFGTYQFNKHPVLISNFTYSLPNDVDYIRASIPPPLVPSTNQYPEKQNELSVNNTARLVGVRPGGVENPPQFVKQDSGIPTYVPTKIQIALTAYPVISRRDVSSNFSVKEYANGNLLLGRDNKNIGAGIW